MVNKHLALGVSKVGNIIAEQFSALQGKLRLPSLSGKEC